MVISLKDVKPCIRYARSICDFSNIEIKNRHVHKVRPYAKGRRYAHSINDFPNIEIENRHAHKVKFKS